MPGPTRESRKRPAFPMKTITQSLSLDFNYPVFFTRDVFDWKNSALSSAVNRLETGRCHRLFFVIDENLFKALPGINSQISRYVENYHESLELVCEPLVLVGGEVVKEGFSHVLRLAEEMNCQALDRQSFMVVVGGGAILDAAGFAASICHRGIRMIRIPSTVLSQSDSGVGVKNGVNLFGKKNFLGTFCPPFAVINDSCFIETLEQRDKIAGIAEAVKVALIRDRLLYEFLEDHCLELSRGESGPLNYQIKRSAELHLEHIRSAGDPFEFGSARPLDFGHWAAHKLESMTRSRLRHGEAVAIGMALDLVYSVRAGFLEGEILERILCLIRHLGLPVWDDALFMVQNGESVILEGLKEFREHLGGALHITLIQDIGESFEVTEMDENLVLDSIRWLREWSKRVSVRVSSS